MRKKKSNLNLNLFNLITIGTSAGGPEALKKIFSYLPANFPLPIVVIQHLHARFSLNSFVNFFDLKGKHIVEAEEKERPLPGIIYFAPPGYHLLLERDGTFALSIDPPVHWSRPSIDVFFDSAAKALESRLIGVILTGANQDGSLGLMEIKKRKGLTIIQDPQDAQVPFMPSSALSVLGSQVDYVFTLDQIGAFLRTFLGTSLDASLVTSLDGVPAKFSLGRNTSEERTLV